jgi:hypothetical protein
MPQTHTTVITNTEFAAAAMRAAAVTSTMLPDDDVGPGAPPDHLQPGCTQQAINPGAQLFHTPACCCCCCCCGYGNLFGQWIAVLLYVLSTLCMLQDIKLVKSVWCGGFVQQQGEDSVLKSWGA